MRTLEPESRSLPPEPHLQRVHLLFVQEVVCQLRRALARGSMHVAQVGIVASESRAATACHNDAPMNQGIDLAGRMGCRRSPKAREPVSAVGEDMSPEVRDAFRSAPVADETEQCLPIHQSIDVFRHLIQLDVTSFPRRWHALDSLGQEHGAFRSRALVILLPQVASDLRRRREGGSHRRVESRRDVGGRGR